MRIRVAHSPDPDDRAMFWAIKKGYIPTKGFEFEFIEAGTNELNALASRSCSGQALIHVCAISAAHYSNVLSSFHPMAMGASIGEGYGPALVTKAQELCGPLGMNALKNGSWRPTLITPGISTTAHKVLNWFFMQPPFSRVEECSIAPMRLTFEVLSRQTVNNLSAAVALIIHEGRLLYENFGCYLVIDIGEEWRRLTGANLVLGMNVISKALDHHTRLDLCEIMKNSCRFFLEKKADFVADYMLNYANNLAEEDLIKYLDMYCNVKTLELENVDKKAFEMLLGQVNQVEKMNDQSIIWY